MPPAIAVWDWNALSGLGEIWTAFPRALPWAKVEPPLRGLSKMRRSERQRHDLVRSVSQIARAVPCATAKHTGQSTTDRPFHLSGRCPLGIISFSWNATLFVDVVVVLSKTRLASK